MIKDIQKEYHTTCFKLFMSLFEQILQENREKLDVAEGDKVKQLQGENRILKSLLKIKERTEVKYTTHDGGFGVK